jgi:outer membrane receptor protein involved in Fe transport
MTQKHSCQKSAIALAVSSILAGGSNAARAQDAPAATPLGEVIVTAQRRSESVLDVPYNISAVSGDAIAAAQMVDSAELMRTLAGVSIVDRGYRNSGVLSGISIRGLNDNVSSLGDFQLSAVPTVSSYVNDTPIYANFLLKDLERVEILRGPQGTLYGSGSLGGTVRYITRAPELGRFSANVKAGFSSTDGSSGNNWSGDLVLNVPIADSAALRVVAGTIDNAGIVDYVNVYQLDANGIPVAPDGVQAPTAAYRSVKDADTVKIDYVRAALLLKPNDSFTATLSYAWQSDDIGGRRQPTRGSNAFGDAYGEYENGSIQLEPSSRDVNLASLEMDFDLGFATLTSSTSHYEHDGKSKSENTGFYVKNVWLADYYYNYPRPMAEADRAYGDKAFVQELRLVSKSTSAWDYVVGGYYQDQDLDATQYSYLRGLKVWSDLEFGVANPVVNDNDFVFERAQNFKEQALFGELTYKINDNLRITGGARYFETDFNNDSILGSGVTLPFSTPIHSVFEQKDSGTLFKGNISYNLAEDRLLYATVSEGYRRAGANAVPTTGNFAESPLYLTYEPDRNTNYEFGLKGSMDTLRYSAALFYIDWKNIQIDTTTPNWGFYAAQNGGDASSKGLELELEGRFAEDWHYTLNYAYTDAKLEDPVYRADHPNDPMFLRAAAGTKLPGTPENSVSGSLDYTMAFMAERSWTNGINASYQSSTENSILTNPASQTSRYKNTWDGFTLVNFVSTLAADKWAASLYVKNVFNEEGVTGGFLEAHMGADTLVPPGVPEQNYVGNGTKQFISLPRTFGVTFSYDFR